MSTASQILQYSLPLMSTTIAPPVDASSHLSMLSSSSGEFNPSLSSCLPSDLDSSQAPSAVSLPPSYSQVPSTASLPPSYSQVTLPLSQPQAQALPPHYVPITTVPQPYTTAAPIPYFYPQFPLPQIQVPNTYRSSSMYPRYPLLCQQEQPLSPGSHQDLSCSPIHQP